MVVPVSHWKSACLGQGEVSRACMDCAYTSLRMHRRGLQRLCWLLKWLCVSRMSCTTLTKLERDKSQLLQVDEMHLWQARFS